MKDWLKRLQAWILKWAATKWGAWALFSCAFADASFLPLPTPMFFLMLTLLDISKAYRYALYGTVGTLLGAIAGYSIGYFAWLNTDGGFTTLAQFVFDTIPGFSEAMYGKIQAQFAIWDFWILFVASFIPVPYKIFSISSGVFNINLVMFCVATLASQGIKFYFFAWLIRKIGLRVKTLMEVKIKPLAIALTAGVAITIIIIKVI